MEEITYSMLSIWYSHVAAVSTSTKQLITVFWHLHAYKGISWSFVPTYQHERLGELLRSDGTCRAQTLV